MRRDLLVFIVCILISINASGQNSLNDLNIVFKHDFENNTLGSYLTEEYKRDWLNPEWNSRQTTTKIVEDANSLSNPTKTLQLFYPESSLGPQEGGAQWWTKLQKNHNELYISYDLMFMPGFQFQKGGKLPSVMGGNVVSLKAPTGYDGFTGGLMFKEDGKIVFYIYYADTPHEGGITVSWGVDSYKETTFAPSKALVNYASGTPSRAIPGKWHNVTYRIVLNTINETGKGNYDGIMEAYFDGKLVTQVSQILFRHTYDLGIDVMRMYSFFGGSTDDWRNPISEWLKVDNFLLFTYKDGINVPRGNKLSPTDRTINFWRNFNNSVDISEPIVPTNNPPVIDNQQFTVQESAFANSFIGKVIASDIDASQILKYSIASGNESGKFVINSQTGDITTTTSNQFVPGTITYELMVQVTDNATDSKSSTAKITVNLVGNSPVVSVNNPPTIHNQQFTIQETFFSDKHIGRVIASESDPGQILSYSIVSGNESALFSLNIQTGDLLTQTEKIFAPGTVTHELQIKVSDNGQEPKSSTAAIKVILVGKSKTVYINPTNSKDLLENGSVEHPFDSWEDVIWKEGYTYLQKRGTTTNVDKIIVGANHLTIGAYGEGDLPVINSNTNTYLISGFEKAGITISHLNLQAPDAVSSVYFLGNTGDSIIVEHCQLNANVNAVKVANGNTLVVRYNTITSNSEGIYSSADDNEVYYNIFRNCAEAINIMGNSAVAKIYNNVFYNNEESLSVTYADLSLYNNIFYMTTQGQTAFNHGNGNIQSNNNIYYPEQPGFIKIANTVYNSLQQLQQDMRIDMNSFISDPQFVDMYNENFAITGNSPAINAGIDLNLDLDILGRSVPVSGTADIGVHEFTGIIAPQEDQAQLSLKLFPNPSTGKFSILSEIATQQESSNNGSSRSEIRVVDLSGKTIFSKQLDAITEPTNLEHVDLTGISNGMYFVILQIADKLVKEKLLINN